MGQTPDTHVYLEAMEEGANQILTAPEIGAEQVEGMGMGQHAQKLLANSR